MLLYVLDMMFLFFSSPPSRGLATSHTTPIIALWLRTRIVTTMIRRWQRLHEQVGGGKGARKKHKKNETRKKAKTLDCHVWVLLFVNRFFCSDGFFGPSRAWNSANYQVWAGRWVDKHDAHLVMLVFPFLGLGLVTYPRSWK